MAVVNGWDGRRILLVPQPKRLPGKLLESWRAANVADGIDWVVGVNKYGVTDIQRVRGHEVVGKDTDGARRVKFLASEEAVRVEDVIAVMNTVRTYGPPLDRVRSPRRLRMPR